ncbi:MAG: (Fe-S)-binding protein [Cytophagaceae bacterium]|jgi:heterodisulfide reductase subunit C|nr:(Fe-S)-binding protein [Cytophagaceae bacterium]
MQVLAQVIFGVIFLIANYFMVKNILRIRKTILLGKDVSIEASSQRWKNVILIAFGQKKMFKKPLPALLHLFVYLGFLIVNLEMIEIIVDGFFGTHRVLFPLLGSLYSFCINTFEFFAAAVIVACLVFLIRRNLIKVPRFSGVEMTSKPIVDANLILVVEILLMVAFLSMNACDYLLQQAGHEHYTSVGRFFISSSLSPLFAGLSSEALVFIERFCWWFHIIGVLAFANYVFMESKHLHIFLAFVNTYFARTEPAGKLQSMESVTREVKLMLNIPVETTETTTEPGRFGAKEVNDLSWKNILDAFSCTECGRCTQQCPANLTGKKLSPRKIMMDTRRRAQDMMKGIESQGKEFSDGKSLLGDYISEGEIMACTTCNACVEACPVLINPVDIIVQLRQYKVMEESQAPASWNMMFSNVENNFAPWKFSPSDRFNWVQKLD